MTLLTSAFLFFVAALGGALNSVAGGGSFLTLPTLIYAGVTPVAANATSTLAMWPGSVSSAFAYRREITDHRDAAGPAWRCQPGRRLARRDSARSHVGHQLPAPAARG